MNIQPVDYPLSISAQLVSILTHEIERSEVDSSAGLIIKFKDPHYRGARGGYHPVEIGLDELGRFQYITDFAYVGQGHIGVLVKELEFDFYFGLFLHQGRDYPILEGATLFNIWQSNFCDYYQHKLYEVTIQGQC